MSLLQIQALQISFPEDAEMTLGGCWDLASQAPRVYYSMRPFLLV